MEVEDGPEARRLHGWIPYGWGFRWRSEPPAFTLARRHIHQHHDSLSMGIRFLHPTPWLLATVLGGMLLSCAGPNGSSDQKPQDDEPRSATPQSELQFEGTVQHRQIEGGAWVIESTDGTTYEPTNLPEEYKEEGLPVRVWADRLDDRASIRMVGPIITIERIERRPTD